MTTTPDVKVITVQQKSPLLGRNVVHDPRSRAFPLLLSSPVDKSTWKNKVIRVYDPTPNPNQEIGCCTGVAKCIQLNSAGNRVSKRFLTFRVGSRVLNMSDAVKLYSRATEIDPYDGTYPPTDTGSSSLASCKSAQDFGIAGAYNWIFGGADEVVQNIMQGRTISVGTWWYEGMFNKDSKGRIRPTGEKVGGHQWAVRGYDVDRDWVMGRCWWGDFRDFWIARTDLQSLLLDDGDAHFQKSI